MILFRWEMRRNGIVDKVEWDSIPITIGEQKYAWCVFILDFVANKPGYRRHTFVRGWQSVTDVAIRSRELGSDVYIYWIHHRLVRSISATALLCFASAQIIIHSLYSSSALPAANMPRNSDSPSSPSPSDFRVIIVGGGISGLTLAASLERAHIKYVLLEARDDIAPQVGASIAIFPHGARILDQLGVYEKVRKLALPHEVMTTVSGGKGKEKKATRLDQTIGDIQVWIARCDPSCSCFVFQLGCILLMCTADMAILLFSSSARHCSKNFTLLSLTKVVS